MLAVNTRHTSTSVRLSIISVSRGTHPDHVVDGVDVRVSHVNSDGSQGEAVLLSRSVDHDGGFGAAHSRREVSARGRVP